MAEYIIPEFKYNPPTANDYYKKVAEMSYQSPIEVTISQMRFEQEKRLEGEVFKAIQDIGVTVDKDELIKALQYDRDQYCRGFIDGYTGDIDKIRQEVKADTVRKMQSEIEARCIKGGIYPAFVKRTISQIAEEIIGGNNADKED